MTMNVLASTSVPASAKHAPKETSGTGSETENGSFAAMMSAAPEAAAALASARGTKQVKLKATDNQKQKTTDAASEKVRQEHEKHGAEASEAKPATKPKAIKAEAGAGTDEAATQAKPVTALVDAASPGVAIPVTTAPASQAVPEVNSAAAGSTTQAKAAADTAVQVATSPTTSQPQIESKQPQTAAPETGEQSEQPGATPQKTAEPMRPGEATELLNRLAQAIERGALQATDAAKPQTIAPAAKGAVAIAGQPAAPAPSATAAPAVPTTPASASTSAPAPATPAAVQVAATAIGGQGSDGSAGQGEERNDSNAERSAKARIAEAHTGANRTTASEFALPSAAASTGAAPTTFAHPPMLRIEGAALSAPGAVGLALGQQVIDMGASGQWLDSISQQIASVAAGNGQGSFQMSPEALGPIRVDITQTDLGAQIQMTVQSEAAQVALDGERDRLIRDAQLASVRIADVRVDRVSQVGDSARSDMNSQQQNSGQQSGAFSQTMNQNNGQHQRGAAFAAGAQDFGNGSGRNMPKAPGDAAVSTDGAGAERSGERSTSARRARYA